MPIRLDILLLNIQNIFLCKLCSFKAKYLNLMTHYSLHPRLTQRWFTRSTSADFCLKQLATLTGTRQSITWLKKHKLSLQWLLVPVYRPWLVDDNDHLQWNTKDSPRHIILWQVINVISTRNEASSRFYCILYCYWTILHVHSSMCAAVTVGIVRTPATDAKRT
jgi:hypothetical protein